MKNPTPSSAPVNYLGLARVVASHCGDDAASERQMDSLAKVFGFVHRKNGDEALKACVLDCIDAGIREGRFPAYVSVRQ